MGSGKESGRGNVTVPADADLGENDDAPAAEAAAGGDESAPTAAADAPAGDDEGGEGGGLLPNPFKAAGDAAKAVAGAMGDAAEAVKDVLIGTAV